jgi:predicted CXXCH cytochrome family protein
VLLNGSTIRLTHALTLGVLLCAAGVLVVGVSIGLANATATQPAPATQPASSNVDNPHGKAGACTACHESADGRYASIPHEKADEICWRCHDGVHAAEEVHPVGRSFDGDNVRLPSGWPVVNNKLTCLTCHDLLAAKHHLPNQSTGNPDFLRGGPIRGGLVKYCSTCHVDMKPGDRPSPHILLNEQGEVDTNRCRFCHTAALDTTPQTMSRSGNAHLIGDELLLCSSCHRQHVDYFTPGHIGATVPAEMKPFIQSQAATPLPLDGSKIVCSTCHNPHQHGVFAPSSPLGRGGLKPDTTNATLPLRGHGRRICGVCHQ